jgi:hypothetical protein
MTYATARLLVVEMLGPAGGGSAGGVQSSPGATVRPPVGGSGTGNRPGELSCAHVHATGKSFFFIFTTIGISCEPWGFRVRR